MDLNFDLSKIDFQDISFRIQEEVQGVVRIVQEKGPKHFQKPFGIAAGVILASYFVVYRPTVGKLAQLQRDISAEMSKAQYAQSYEEIRYKMLGYYAKLPKPDRKDGWLFDSILQSAQQQGIILDSIGSQAEAGPAEFWVLSIEVKTRASYARLGKWMEQLENQTPGLYVTGLDISKPDQPTEGLGVNQIRVQISTVMPKRMMQL